MQNNGIYEKENSRKKVKDKKQSSFTGVLFRILNCIATVLLVSFLIAGIAYNVLSWLGLLIVLALFLPHMTCCVVIPLFTRRKQPIRLYKTIVLPMWILFFVFATVRVFWPGNDKWRTYTFEAELEALEAKRSIPVAENAATLYEPILAQIDINAMKWKVLDEHRPFPANHTLKESKDRMILVWVDDYTEAVQDLMRACQMEQCYFPIRAEPFADASPMSKERHDKFKLCSFLLFSAAEQDFSDGRMEAGLEKCRCVIRMARHYSQQTTITSCIDGFWIERYALTTIRKVIMENNTTDKNLLLIAESIDIEYNWSKDWSQILEVEKLRMKNLSGAFYEVNPQGRLRFGCRFHTSFPWNSPGSSSTVDWRRKIGDKLAPFGLALLVPSRPETAGKIIDDIFEKYFAATNQGFSWYSLKECNQYRLKQMRCLRGMRFFLEYYPHITDVTSLLGFHDLYMRFLSKRREFHIMIGLLLYKNKYGHWPVALEDIKSLISAKAFVDPVNGGYFGYELINDTFKLYRKCRNNGDGKQINIERTRLSGLIGLADINNREKAHIDYSSKKIELPNTMKGSLCNKRIEGTTGKCIRTPDLNISFDSIEI